MKRLSIQAFPFKKHHYSVLLQRQPGKWTTAFTGKIDVVRGIAKAFKRAGFKMTSKIKQDGCVARKTYRRFARHET